MTTLPAAAAMATIIVEPENLLRMMISSGLQCVSATGFPMNPELVWMVAFFGIGLWSGCKVGARIVVDHVDGPPHARPIYLGKWPQAQARALRQ